MPLERGRDQLVLRTGEAVEIPFHVTLLFSTNLQPDDLADYAYLRRIPYKVFIPSCRHDQFAEILSRSCETLNVEYDDVGLRNVTSFVETVSRDGLCGALARDLVSIVAENSRQEGLAPVLSVPAIELAFQQFTGIPGGRAAARAIEEDAPVPDFYQA
jgi:hypothetical protein